VGPIASETPCTYEGRVTQLGTVVRPKKRWIEEVERELKGMGVKDWKRLADKWDKWKKIVEEAKA
jgi:hypothetical protein